MTDDALYLPLAEIVTRWAPWSAVPETWTSHAAKLQAEQPEYQRDLRHLMERLDGWIVREKGPDGMPSGPVFYCSPGHAPRGAEKELGARRISLGQMLVRGPVKVHDGFVQDAHHRLVMALELGWTGRLLPVQHIRK